MAKPMNGESEEDGDERSAADDHDGSSAASAIQIDDDDGEPARSSRAAASGRQEVQKGKFRGTVVDAQSKEKNSDNRIDDVST